MATTGRALLLAVALITALTPAIAAAREDPGDPSPAVKSFNLKQINKGSITSRALAWVVTGKRSSVVFYLQPDDTYTDYEAFSLAISDKGKTSTPNSFWSGQGQQLYHIAAVWLPKAGYGMVFLAYETSSSATQANVVGARFDEDGELISGFRLLHTFSAPASAHFFNVSLGAGVREGRMGVAAAAICNEDSLYDLVGVRNSMGQFIEVDTKLKPKGKLTMKLPGAGSRLLTFVYKPMWTGKKWMMPLACTFVALGANSYYPNYYYPYGNALYVTRAEVKNDKVSKSRTKLLAKDSERDFISYRNPQFVVQGTGEAPPAAKGVYPILYSHRSLLPDTEWQYSRYDYNHHLEAVNDKSKRVWGPLDVSLPAWMPGTFTQSNEGLGTTDCAISFPVQREDGSILIAVARSSTWYNRSTFAYRADGIIELFSVDPTNGDLRTLARRTPGWLGPYGRPMVRIINGRIAVITYYSDYSLPSASPAIDYFSKF